MKNLVLIITLALVTLTSCMSFQNLVDRPLKPRKEIGYKICAEISQEFKEKYNFSFSGIWEVGPEGKYKLIGLDFDCPRILTKEEGRELLLTCEKEALDAFNSHPEFEEHMDNVPFTYDNINITIFVHPPESFDVYSPNIFVFTLLRKTLEYEKQELVGDRIRYTSETETLEEAMQIVGKNQ